jgi:hypothetical protein
MLRGPLQRNVFVWMLCITMLVMRIGGAHIHVCLDGSEPPASLHIGDNGIHDQHHPSGAHVDAAEWDSDVSVPGDALVKNLTGDVDLPTLAATLCLLLFIVPLLRIFTRYLDPPLVRISGRSQLLPPPRGPPA